MPVNKFTLNGKTLIDLSHDTVEKSSLIANETAHAHDGKSIIGSANAGNPGSDYYVDANGILYRYQALTSPYRLRVMTYNVGGWYMGEDEQNVPAEKVDEYRTLQRTILSNQQPDVVGIQEYWYYFDQDNTITAEDIIGKYFVDICTFDVHSKHYGKAIASKVFPLEDYKHYRFNVYIDHPTYGNTYYYGFERAYVNVNGKRICIINTWLDSNDRYWDNRKEEVAQLLDYIATEPYFVLMGDFNVDCPNGVDEDHYIDFIKPFVDAGYNVCNNAIRNGAFIHIPTYYRRNGTSEALDQIITSSNITVENVFIDRTKLDDQITEDKIDHVPFIADLVIN